MDLISLLASLPPPFVQPNKLDIFQTCSSVLFLESLTATLQTSQCSRCPAPQCSPSFRQLNTFSVSTFTFTKCQTQFLSSFTQYTVCMSSQITPIVANNDTVLRCYLHLRWHYSIDIFILLWALFVI